MIIYYSLAETPAITISKDADYTGYLTANCYYDENYIFTLFTSLQYTLILCSEQRQTTCTFAFSSVFRLDIPCIWPDKKNGLSGPISRVLPFLSLKPIQILKGIGWGFDCWKHHQMFVKSPRKRNETLVQI